MTAAERFRSAIPAAVACALIGVLLSGCSADEPTPPASTGQASPSKTRSPGAGDSTPAATIEPVIVVASVDVDGEHVTASGYVSGVVENEGACTFVFTGNGQTVRAEHAGSADRMSTSCGVVKAPIDSFSRGSWSVTLQYTSHGRSFASGQSTVEIP